MMRQRFLETEEYEIPFGKLDVERLKSYGEETLEIDRGKVIYVIYVQSTMCFFRC